MELTPEGHPDRLSRVYNLGVALQSRFERMGDVGDLDRAMKCAQQLVELSAGNHPEHSRRLHFLGQLLMTRLHSSHAHDDDTSRALEVLGIQSNV